jgi:hypothetical protein
MDQNSEHWVMDICLTPQALPDSQRGNSVMWKYKETNKKKVLFVFVVYLKTLPDAQIKFGLEIWWAMNNELERMWEESVMT